MPLETGCFFYPTPLSIVLSLILYGMNVCETYILFGDAALPAGRVPPFVINIHLNKACVISGNLRLP